jgi:type I restriction enzyme S subunit
MIEGLKPYAEYKESGLPWLDTVPKHWDMAPNRALMRDQRQVVGARASEYTLLSLTLRGVIARDMVNPKGKFPAQFNTYKVVKPDDFVFCLFDIDETPRGVGLSPLKGMITGAYDIFSPTPRINPRFLYHYYLFVDEGKLMKPLYTGLRKTIQRGVFASLKAPLPPPDEQAAIVRFLDHANRKIDGFIRAKRKLIGLLNEQKQAIIHRSVTSGLHPDVPLKPSGIPWLGDIPIHWGIVRNMALFAHRVEPGIAGLPVLQVSLRSGITAEELDQFGRPKRLIADATKYKRIHEGDMAYNTMRMWQGAVGVSPSDGLVSPAYVVLKPRKDTCPEFYDFIFHTEVYKQQVNRQSTGIVSDRNRLYWDSFKQMPNLTLPTTEQKEIVAYIAQETAALNTAIARTEREIALMQEYRTRLTADLVTGKLDVREAAAHLPAPPVETAVEPTPDEPLEGIETEEAPE